jgi:prevent-host-death family protein
MTDVASRQLRNNTRAVLDRVAAGEAITITVDGRPVALLAPVGRRPRWLARRDFTERVLAKQADPGLRAELRGLAPDTTDDLASP